MRFYSTLFLSFHLDFWNVLWLEEHDVAVHVYVCMYVLLQGEVSFGSYHSNACVYMSILSVSIPLYLYINACVFPAYASWRRRRKRRRISRRGGIFFPAAAGSFRRERKKSKKRGVLGPLGTDRPNPRTWRDGGWELLRCRGIPPRFNPIVVPRSKKRRKSNNQPTSFPN